jgi:hypothetical protein
MASEKGDRMTRRQESQVAERRSGGCLCRLEPLGSPPGGLYVQRCRRHGGEATAEASEEWQELGEELKLEALARSPGWWRRLVKGRGNE